MSCVLYTRKWARRREEKSAGGTEGRRREKRGTEAENVRKPREYWKERERMN